MIAFGAQSGRVRVRAPAGVFTIRPSGAIVYSATGAGCCWACTGSALLAAMNVNTATRRARAFFERGGDFDRWRDMAVQRIWSLAPLAHDMGEDETEPAERREREVVHVERLRGCFASEAVIATADAAT